jgi:hypothetical protein
MRWTLRFTDAPTESGATADRARNETRAFFVEVCDVVRSVDYA